MSRLILPSGIARQIVDAANRSPEREVCGLIGAARGAPVSVYAITNVAAAPRRCFSMDAGEQIRAFKAMRERGESLFAIYHSHPDGTTRPSAADAAGLGYPEAHYLIVTPGAALADALRAWRLVGQRFCPLELAVAEAQFL